ncbi:MAG: sulfur oxidation c-type cytochrome SoxX [Mesorhizobium sp.]|uniref:sulfur oxidation c-type cytochrome SoxX n=2 Tax=Mesorhizobium sp. TaxID=1871066 RepID=UPI001204AFEA|nr:sulfur oxidation c-type cytochrome SoxX [Mesorhizobium sp.]TIO10144.1 MAG: sulfur oxidation c-type cytochrome SoxX [Mesorhizobium sp.]TIP09598.1 MAG: sulfur oxidation c-type cytochrome SoxX [Mesorhizobium sp.]
MRMACSALTGLLLAISPGVGEEAGSYAVTGDAIMEPLAGGKGDPARGAALISDRQRSLCTLCHSGPFPDAHLHGTLAPDLTGVGARLSEGQIRLRVVDMKRLAPNTIMPSYYRVAEEEGRRVATVWRSKPILAGADIEDIVAYLTTLKG